MFICPLSYTTNSQLAAKIFVGSTADRILDFVGLNCNHPYGILAGLEYTKSTPFSSL